MRIQRCCRRAHGATGRVASTVTMADEERAAWGAGSELPADLQAPDGPEVLDLSRQGLDAPTADTNLALLDDTARVRVARLQHNLLERLPDRVGALSRLHTLDVSHNRLGALPEELGALPALRVLLAAGNRLRYLPKALAGLADLEVVNLSGNSLDALPPPLLALGSLRALYLGANSLECVPEDIGKLQKLEVLYLGGNRLQELPAGLGSLGQLQSLVLSGNRLVALPPSLSCLHRLRSLALHDNLLTTLPPCLVRLQNLVELSLRGNPLVVRFVRDLTYEPPRLRELAARCVKIHRLPCGEGELPPALLAYLDTARRCVNPRCKGVYFDARVEHIKFVDFCGKYRLPLLQYLCSAQCSSQLAGSGSESEASDEEGGVDPSRLRRVLLG